MLHKDRHGKINLPYSFLSIAKLELHRLSLPGSPACITCGALTGYSWECRAGVRSVVDEYMMSQQGRSPEGIRINSSNFAIDKKSMVNLSFHADPYAAWVSFLTFVVVRKKTDGRKRKPMCNQSLRLYPVMGLFRPKLRVSDRMSGREPN